MSNSGSFSRASSYSPTESVDYTPLQLAVLKESLDEARYLVESGDDINAGLDPPLHIAIRRKDHLMARLLLQSGADFDIKDSYGNYPIHIACSLGLLDIVHSLCTLGCSVEVLNAKGLYPLHLAAKKGHINVVRCLCAAGCNIDIRNSDNIRADITALKYGHNDIAELLDRLRATGHRDAFARQLVPTTKPAVRISVRLLGNCGVGKTAFAKSLGAGLFSSLFRRSSSLQSNKSRPSSPINTQIEMDVTSRQNSITFEPSGHYHSTKGIHVQNMDISNVGDVTIWEFSGQENYFPVYHHFLRPSPYAITAILFSLEDPPSVQVQQACFWLNFLLARQKADSFSSEYGPIVLIATHVDVSRAVKNQHGEWISPDAQKTAETVRRIIHHTPRLMATPLIVDCNVPASHAFKHFKTLLTTLKHDSIQHAAGTCTGLLEATSHWLTSLQKDYEQFPVVNKNTFAELLRNQVNLLALDGHIEDVLRHLYRMGEVFCIRNLVVISLPWFGSNLMGELLSTNFLLHARVIGVYTAEDFQASYNECDALGVLELLEAMDLCIHCEVDGEVEYEFPVYNQQEMIEGLWEPDDTRFLSYGGLRLYIAPGLYHLLTSLFPYMQVELRRLSLQREDEDSDLFQWYHGSKFCTGILESMITLEEDDDLSQCIEVKVRGPKDAAQDCFYFMEEIMRYLQDAIWKVCPGLLTERHILSALQLKLHSPVPFCYEPHVISAAMLEAESTLDVLLYNPEIDRPETIIELLLFNDEELASNIHWGCVLKIKDLPAPAKLKLCGLLDPPDRHGRDWCLLALKLGFSQEKIAALDSHHSSHTMRLLTSADCTIGALITSLHELDRLDAAEVVLRSAPLFKVIEHVVV